MRNIFITCFRLDVVNLIKSHFGAHEHSTCELEAIGELLRLFDPLDLPVCADKCLIVLFFTSDQLI